MFKSSVVFGKISAVSKRAMRMKKNSQTRFRFAAGRAICTALAVFSASDAFCLEEAAVKDFGGVPMLEIDGAPARSRMFYTASPSLFIGSPTLREVRGNEDWTKTFFIIRPLKKDMEDVSLEIALSGRDAEFFVKSLELADCSSGETVKLFDFSDKALNPQDFVHPLSEGKVSVSRSDGSLRVCTSDNAGKVLKFGGLGLKAGRQYRANLLIRGKNGFNFNLFAVSGKNIFAPQPFSASLMYEQVSYAKDAGVDIVTVVTPAQKYMPQDGKSMDFSGLKKDFERILSANPKAKILLRIRLFPPSWWMAKYPEDCMTDERGRSDKTFASPSSERFLADSEKVLKTVIEFCEKNYPENILGYHTAGGNSCEWFYGNFWNGRLYGYGKAERDAWKKWVAKKYPDDKSLAKAWNDSTATLDEVDVPTPQERRAQVFIINPQEAEKIADYNRFLQDAMLDAVLRLTKFVRNTVPHRLSVVFYGYTHELTRVNKGAAASGHYRLWRMLKSKDIDAVSGPTSYVRRDLGDGSAVMSACETITRHGKIWINEDDTRTYLCPAGLQQITPAGKELRSKRDTVNVLRRNMSQTAVRNLTSWWMDLVGVGWFADKDLWSVMKSFEKPEADMRANPVVYAPEVAVVTDEESVMYTGTFGGVYETTRICSQIREKLNRCAVPSGQYLFRDYIESADLSPKLAIFPILYALDAKDRKVLRQKTENQAAIFFWLPAYIDLDKKKFSTEAVEEATGFKVEPIFAFDMPAKAYTTQAGLDIGMPENFGFDTKVVPLLRAKTQAGDIVFAKYSDGSAAVVLRGKKLFCGVAEIPEELVKYMAGISGAHIYAKSAVSVFANGAYISATCLEEKKDGAPVEIDTNFKGEIFDALTGEKIGDGPVVKMQMRRGDSVMLRLGNGNADFAAKGRK